jgi:hypothetical protein
VLIPTVLDGFHQLASLAKAASLDQHRGEEHADRADQRGARDRREDQEPRVAP